MRTRDQEEFQRKKIMLMEKCYDCYAENGLASVGIRKLAEDCGVSYLTPFVAKGWQHKGGGWVVRGPMPDIKLRELSLNPEGKRRQK